MLKEEYLEKYREFKSRAPTTFKCAECNNEVSKIKKQVLRSIKETESKFLFCSSSCSSRNKKPRIQLSCFNCNNQIFRTLSSVSRRNFCSQSCSASVTNRGKVRSDESKNKTRESVLNYLNNLISEQYPKECLNCYVRFQPSSSNQKFCSKQCRTKKRRPRVKPITRKGRVVREIKVCKLYFCFCDYCKQAFSSRSRQRVKYCSKNCLKSAMSKRQSERLSKVENRKNLGRGKKSWLESSFETWLIEKGIKFETEVKFKNEELNKNYFVDFFFKHLNLIIELDGTQHRKTKQSDTVRDEYITRVYGIKVIRIDHRDYVKKTRYEEICKILNVTTV